MSSLVLIAQVVFPFEHGHTHTDDSIHASAAAGVGNYQFNSIADLSSAVRRNRIRGAVAMTRR